MRWPESSIVRRLVVGAVLAGVVTGLLGGLVLRAIERRALLADASARTVAVADRTATRVDGRVTALEAQVRLLASRPSIVSLDPRADTELAVALRVTTELDELVLFDLTGTPVAAAASSRLLRATDVPRRPDAPDGLETGPAARIVTLDEGPSLELRSRVEDPPGTPVGVLLAHAPVELLHEEAETPLLGTGASSFLVADDGRLVGHRELDRVLSGEVFDLRETFPEGARATRLEVDGVASLAAVAPITAMPVSVIVTQPEAEAVAGLQTPTDSLTALYLAVVVATVGALVVIARRSLRPLGDVVAAVERLGAGDLSARVATEGTGEVRLLAHGVNEMAGRLQQRQEELASAERAVRSSEERLRMMVEGVVDYALVLLDPDGEVRSWNTGASRLLGVPADRARGAPLARFFEDERAAKELLTEAMRSDRAEIETWCRRGAGERFRAQVVARALSDEGVVSGYAVVLHDMTQRHVAREAIEESLRRQEQAAEELRRANELKDDFLAIAAHELRTPLTAIIGSSHLLSTDWDELSEAERIRFRDVIDHHAEDMRLIVDRLLHFSRLQAGRVRVRPSRIDLRAELDSHLADLARHLADHRVEVDVDGVAEVEVDPVLLRHVTTNLLSNAAKFSGPGSTVRVGLRLDDGHLELRVADQGIGIPEQDHERIFELFEQSANDLPTSRGTGVGLAIVRRYLALVGGTVEVDSRPGRGSTFTVRIPVDGSSTEASA